MSARRRYLAVAAAAAMVFAARPAGAETVVKVGVILTYSGQNAQVGEWTDKGVSLYVKEHEKDLPPGVKIEIIRRDDTGSKPEVAKRLATELITRDHVKLLTGVIWTPNAAAIAPVVTQAKLPFIVMVSAGSTVPALSPYIVRVSFTEWQLIYPLGQWAAKQGWKTGYTMVSDFSPGWDAEIAFQKGFADGGGKLIGAVRVPFAESDLEPFVQRIKDAKPDVTYIFTPSGRQATQVMRTWRDLGMKDNKIHVVAGHQLVPDEELPNIGDVALGVVSSGNYSPVTKRPANEKFLAAWQHEYGSAATAVPDFLSVQGWDGMDAIFDVIKKTGGKFDGDEAMNILKHWSNPDSPRGPTSIDPATRDVVQNVYMRRVEKVDGRLANVEFETFKQVKGTVTGMMAGKK